MIRVHLPYPFILFIARSIIEPGLVDCTDPRLKINQARRVPRSIIETAPAEVAKVGARNAYEAQRTSYPFPILARS